MDKLTMSQLRKEEVLFTAYSCLSAMNTGPHDAEATCYIHHFAQRDGVTCEIKVREAPQSVYHRWIGMREILTPRHLSHFADIVDVEEGEDHFKIRFTYYR